MPSKPSVSSFSNIEKTHATITIKGSEAPHISADLGLIDKYKVISINGSSPASQLIAASNADLEITGLEAGSLHEIELSNVVDSISECGTIESAEFATLTICTSKIIAMKYV